MVYNGKPSMGRRNCRQRHIKCDEARPHCKACTRTGRACPGYPHPFDVMLRDHTPSFRKPQPLPYSPATSGNETGSGKNLPDLPSNLVVSRRAPSLRVFPMADGPWPPSLPPGLYQPLEDTVVPMFFNCYLYLPKDPQIRNGFMEILPQNYSHTKPDSHLHVSTLAIAFFSVAAWTGQASLLRASEKYFTKALPKIREALQNTVDGELDDTFLSILLLSTYEEFIAMRDWKLPMKAHLRGAIALINKRRSKRLETPASSTIDHAIQTQIIKTTRALSNPMVPTPKVWPLSRPELPLSPRPMLATAASELVDLRHAWDSMMDKPPDEATTTAILNKATDIDVNLTAWSQSVPSHWAPVAAVLIPQSVRDAGLYRDRCDCYSDMWIAATWNTYRDCRVLVQSIILSCLRILSSSQDVDGSRAASVIATAHGLADDICATVPFFLGSQLESVRMKFGLVEYPSAETRPVTLTHNHTAPLIGAWFVMPFLRNLKASGLGLPQEQLDWLQRQMERILVIYFTQ
ncbi:hypothetical protein N7474_005893 [Penicillium riverlandense]|uniref:uncharacterized protein n=1 Tax=Penicillium riverlandense TaxID=1903569 RepID=UPI002548C3CC|nr:uncharacterized protein N7474_005893 [Penicillium riverlandense]KAJ5820302.1 hypothetical protein N7474_005893 [Penicillium riverlandense]